MIEPQLCDALKAVINDPGRCIAGWNDYFQGFLVARWVWLNGCATGDVGYVYEIVRIYIV